MPASPAMNPLSGFTLASAASAVVAQPRDPWEPGDFLPFFHLPDKDKMLREIQRYGGDPVALFFLPADGDGLENFFQTMRRFEADYRSLKLQSVFILPVAPEALQEIHERVGVTLSLWSDAQGRLSRALGVEMPVRSGIVSYLADANLKIKSICLATGAEAHLQQMAEDCRRLILTQPALWRSAAPVMVVPDAISPAMCDELMRSWKDGKHYEGTIGSGNNRRVDKSRKRRTDVDIADRALLARIDGKLSRSLFPEIRKVGSFSVRYREMYKIGRYCASEEGFYGRHRDTFAPYAYRHYSLTLCLNDGYDGGGLIFPEYGQDVCLPAPGSAVVFPSTLVHEVTPVTRGERFAAISFMFGEDEARIGAQAIGNILPHYRVLRDDWVFNDLPTGMAYTHMRTS